MNKDLRERFDGRFCIIDTGPNADPPEWISDLLVRTDDEQRELFLEFIEAEIERAKEEVIEGAVNWMTPYSMESERERLINIWKNLLDEFLRQKFLSPNKPLDP